MSDEDELFAGAMSAIAAGDLRNARRLLRQAADADHPPAMMIYAAWVEYGVGSNPSEHKALTYYRRAADLGNPTACLRVARWHSDRKQIPQAKFWLHKSFNYRARLAEIRLDLKSRSYKTTANVSAQLWHLHAKPTALTATKRVEVKALIAIYKSRRPNVAKATAGRDKIREAKRRQRGTGVCTTP